jgi:transcriptional regulator with XRE-family HTH domain
MQNLGITILKLREKYRYSQTALAHLLNISQSKLSLWESGISIPNILEAQILTQIFGITLEDLVSDNIS